MSEITTINASMESHEVEVCVNDILNLLGSRHRLSPVKILLILNVARDHMIHLTGFENINIVEPNKPKLALVKD